MTQTVLIDTDILIDFGRDIDQAVHAIAHLEADYQLATSVVTVMELYAGCRSKRDLNMIDGLISEINIEHITGRISAKALDLMKKYRSSHGVEINDMIIAATAIKSNIKLITKNQKHYRFLDDLDLITYPLNHKE